MMKTMYRVALVMGLMMTSATAVEAEERNVAVDESVTPHVFVMNNYLADVRVYIEDADGKLHNLGRLTRGSLGSFALPSEISEGDFRVRVVPAPRLASPIHEDIAIGTTVLNGTEDQQVRVWVETNLTDSIVEIGRD